MPQNFFFHWFFTVIPFTSCSQDYTYVCSSHYPRLQVNVNLAGLPALVLPCGFVEGGPVGLPVGLQMIGAAFDEVLKTCIFYKFYYGVEI